MFIYCLGFLFIANQDDLGAGRVVLIKKKRGPPNVRGRKNGIGGKIELPDETPLDAMIRETREEIGVATDRETWLPFGVMSGPDWRCHLFTGWLPDGQEPRTMEDEEVGVELAAACFGDSYVANIPTLLSLAEHALDSLTFEDEPVWVELTYHADIGAHVVAEASASVRSLQMWSAAQPASSENVLFKAGDLRISSFTAAPTLGTGEFLGSLIELGDGQRIRILPNTADAWTYERPPETRTITHLALVPSGQQPNHDCVLVVDEPNFAMGVRSDGTTIFDTDQDAPAVLTVLSPSEETVAPTAQALLDATATIDPIQPFELDLSRYLRSEMKDADPGPNGEPMALATCWVDYAALADDMEAARLPGELVAAVRALEPRQGGEGAHVASTAPVKPIVAHPGWAPMLGFIDDGLGAYCPRHPLLAWAAMGQTATVAQRTVHADWGIAFDGTREPVASFSGDEVELFWAPVGLSDDELAYFVPINVDRIRWPFVESEARPEHFAALGFRVLV